LIAKHAAFKLIEELAPPVLAKTADLKCNRMGQRQPCNKNTGYNDVIKKALIQKHRSLTIYTRWCL